MLWVVIVSALSYFFVAYIEIVILPRVFLQGVSWLDGRIGRQAQFLLPHMHAYHLRYDMDKLDGAR